MIYVGTDALRRKADALLDDARMLHSRRQYRDAIHRWEEAVPLLKKLGDTPQLALVLDF